MLRRVRSVLRGAAVLLAVVLPAHGLAQNAVPSETIVLPEIDVIATPLDGAAGEGRQAGGSNRLSAEDIARERSPSVVDTIGRRIPSASLSDVQGNEFTQDLHYRGFAASALQGTPQGLAVYQNGMRLNEAFGDTLNWDLVPPLAIRNVDVYSNNPIFGLNALGGAVNIEMKDGFTYQGFEATLLGGSYGRISSALQYGAQSGNWALYLAGDAVRDGGWRFQSASRVARFYADLGYRIPGSEVHVAVAGARDALGVIGPTPIQLTQIDDRSIFTWPQTTDNQTGSVAVSGKFELPSAWTLQGNLYVRRFDQRHVDGNVAEFESCSRLSSFGGRLCLEDDAFGTPPGGKTTAFRDQFVILGPAGQTFPAVAGAPYGTIDRTKTGTTTIGATVQGTHTGRLWGRRNAVTLGTSIDYGDVRFASSSTLSFVYPDLVVGSNLAVPGTGIGPLRTAGSLGYAPVNLAATTTYFGLYVTDTFDITDRLSVGFGGRFNLAAINTNDLTGAAAALNGSHNFARFNPFVGPAFRITPDITLYAGYSEANRAPTALELSCSDSTRPCLLANSLVADPPLKQVVSRAYEAGLRGSERAQGDRLDWKIGLYRTDLDDDIISLASSIQGRGFFSNVPGTRRQGIEAGMRFRTGPWSVYADYSLVDATFEFSGLLASPNNPMADSNGNITVHPGDRLPLVPRHQFKAGLDYAITAEWQIGADVVAFSSQFYAGDESNQNAPLPAYWVANLHSSYRVTDRIQLFLDVRNLFDRRYATYGAFFEPSSVANAGLSDARTITLAQPLSVYGGIRITW